uniref:CBM20 domain-containing protein n=1 Tax=Kalanchoe fedtschenkoi TaxID=63787 RepID=A0A7N1A8M5_KALFE
MLSVTHSPYCYFSMALPVAPPPPRYFPPIPSASPYICHHVPLKSFFACSLCPKKPKSLLASQILSMNRDACISLMHTNTWRPGLPNFSVLDSSTFTEEGLCKVVWIVEAELKDDQLLYVTGDITGLGCWNTELGILMEPTENTNIWRAEAEVAFGINLKYNYFIKRDMWPACDIVWRPGPQFSLSVSLPHAQNRELLVRDLWTRLGTKLPASRLWSSWMDDLYYPAQSLALNSASDAPKNATCLKGKLHGVKPVINGFLVKDLSVPNGEEIVRVLSEDMDDDKAFSERNQPVEEPWLHSRSSHFYEDKVDGHDSKAMAVLEDSSIVLDVHTDPQLTQMMLPEDECKLVSHNKPVSTVILINSSLCTMQRIAIMEDGKLVELLLEPVKSDVQSESVYLGVVMKHVPHMGGAFVDIGISRPSLMDIKNNREPYIFPSLHHATKDKAEHCEIESTLINDVQVTNDIDEIGFQDDQTRFVHDDYDEHEIEDEFDIPEVAKENINGTISGDVDSECAGYVSGLQELLEVDGVSNAVVPVKVNGSEYSQSDLRLTQDIKSKPTTINKWSQVQKGTKIIVQVVKEGLGTKGPTLTAYPKLRSRFWILHTRCDRIGISKKISGIERTRLKVIAKTLQPKGFGLTVRTVAAGHSLEELQKDLEGLLSTWKIIMEHAKSAALAADEGVDGAVPMILHKAMGQTLSVVQDYFNDKVERLVLDSPRTYHEVTNYLQDIAPDLCDRVELYDKRVPLFDEFNIEEEMNNILSKRVPLANGGSLVIEQTEALVSIDVNGGHGMLGQGTSQEKAILEVNLAAAKQIARELRLRDIGGIIVIDFIDMEDEAHKRLVYEEVKNAVEKDRSMVKVSELSRHGLMEITRKRVRPSVTFMISEPCACCHATGRVEALETSFAKIEQEICRQLASKKHTGDPGNPKSWPKFMLMVDRFMCNYLTSGKRTRLAILSSSLKVWILLKVARGFTRGAFEVKSLSDDDKASIKPPQVPIPILRTTEGRPHNANRKVTLIPVKKWKAVKK